MKKTISVILSLVFVLSLASCTGIGDGALFGGHTLQDAEDADTEAPWRYAFVSRSYGVASSILAPIHYLDENDAAALYLLFTGAKYDTESDRTGYTEHCSVWFSPDNSANVDDIFYYTINSDDTVVNNGKAGKIEGIYAMVQKLYDESEPAKFKLNTSSTLIPTVTSDDTGIAD